MPRIPIPEALEKRLARQFLRRTFQGSRNIPLKEYGHTLGDRARGEVSEKREKKTAALIADEVLFQCKVASLDTEQLNELAKDLQEQMQVHGPQAVQNKKLRDAMKVIQRESNRQTYAGLGGGALGALAGAGSGAVLTTMLRGRRQALLGAGLGVIPGALAGHYFGKRLQQRRELADVLKKNL